MNTREEDLAEADALDAFIKIFGPKNRKIREEMIPRWVAEMKDLRTRGMHEEG